MSRPNQDHNAIRRTPLARNSASSHFSRQELQSSNQSVQGVQKVAAPLTQIVRRAQSDPSRISSSDVLQLQRTIGNQGVVQLLNRSAPQAHPPAIQASPAAAPAGERVGVKAHTNSNALQAKSISALGAHTQIQRFPWSRNKPKITVPTPEEYPPKLKNLPDNRDADGTVPHIANEVVEQGDTFRLTLGVEEAEENFISGSMKYHLNKMMGRFGKQNLDKPYSTGHAWVELQVFGDSKRLAFDSYGFSGAGLEHPDHNTGARGSEYLLRDYTVGKRAFQKVIDRVRTLEAKGLQYKTKGYNCTSFARDLVKTAGISFPGSRMLPGMRVGAGSVFTPARLHQALAKGEKKGTAYKRMKQPKSIDDVLGSPDPQEVIEAMSSQEGSSERPTTSPPDSPTTQLSIPAISQEAERVLMQNLHRENPLQTLIDHEVATKEKLEDMSPEQVAQLAEYIGSESTIVDGWMLFLMDS